MMELKLLHPSQCEPPHKITNFDHYDTLVQDIAENGWDMRCPDLKGYTFLDKVQLLSGSHRWAAANAIGIKIPVQVYTFEEVEKAWGNLEGWKELMYGS